MVLSVSSKVLLLPPRSCSAEVIVLFAVPSPAAAHRPMPRLRQSTAVSAVGRSRGRRSALSDTLHPAVLASQAPRRHRSREVEWRSMADDPARVQRKTHTAPVARRAHGDLVRRAVIFGQCILRKSKNALPGPKQINLNQIDLRVVTFALLFQVLSATLTRIFVGPTDNFNDGNNLQRHRLFRGFQ